MLTLPVGHALRTNGLEVQPQDLNPVHHRASGEVCGLASDFMVMMDLI